MDLGVHTNSTKIYLQALCVTSEPIGKNRTSVWKKKKRLTGPSGRRLTPILRAQIFCVVIAGLPGAN